MSASPRASAGSAWRLPAAASLPFIAVSVALHVGYQVFLVMAYRIGDLTQVYPVARGSAPLIVAALSTLGMLGMNVPDSLPNRRALATASIKAASSVAGHIPPA